MWILFAVALFAALGPCAAEAAAKVKVQVVEFDVHGTTPEEVVANILRNSFRSRDGRSAIAVTSSDHWMDITPVERDGGCVVGAVTLWTGVVINTPRLANPLSLPPKARNAFAAYFRDVLRHEKGHQKLRVAAGQKMEKEIRSLPPQSSCMLVRQKAEAVIVRIRRESDRENREYDERELREAERKWGPARQ
jgi:predicted secreted Zn-dependent protease